MPFRFWFYVTKACPVLFVIVLATFLASSESALGRVRFVTLCLAVLLGLIGACMAILAMLLGKLRMLCPFCGQSGPVGGNKQDGMWMECETCGLIHSGGRFGLKIVKADQENDAT